MPAKPEILWPLRAHVSAIRAGDVHLWCVGLDDREDQAGPPLATLSADERQRALRLRFPRDRRRFVLARTRLREILARYLEVGPARLRFAYGPSGKPTLVQPVSGRDLQFNLSHCGALALYAVAVHEPVGVDLEQIRPLADLPAIATRFFSPAEVAWLRRLEPDRRPEAFFQLWTQKEALGKAQGTTLDESLLAVDFAPSSRRRRLNGSRAGTFSPWIVTRLQPATGYVGAVALTSPTPHLQLWQWAPGEVEESRRIRTMDCA